MRIIKILFITIFSFILIFTAIFLLTKNLILAKIESTIIKKIENAIQKKIDIGGIAYLPHRGIALKNINIYEKDFPAQEGISINSFYIKPNLARLFATKEILLTIRVDGIKKNELNANGLFLLESNPFKNILKPFKSFSLNTINISNFKLSSPFLNLKGISGVIYFKENEISAPEITFYYKNKINKLSFYSKDLQKEPIFDINISGDSLNVDAQLKKIKDLIKINKSEIRFFNSYFEGEGEISNLKNPSLLLYISSVLDTRDISCINTDFEDACSYLRLDGRLDSQIYFNGPLSQPMLWEIGLKGQSPMLRIWGYHFRNLSLNIRLDNGIITTPLLTAYPYDGILNSSFKMDLSNQNIPYSMNLRLQDININGLAQDSELRNKNIYGRLNSELFIKGYGGDTNSITGGGNIVIREANLGPMPILSPLLGNVYGVLRNMMPGLRSVEISSGTCDFVIKNRKIMTDNLFLWGDTLNIKARGYIDFDKNLNFDVENELKEVTEKAEDWQKTLVDIIAGFGKFLGRAHLRGTLNKPKWEFEYFSGFKDSLEGKLKGVFRDIFE